jgi:hypothetical protein
MGGKEIRSCEGTTQGDPIAMPMYALATIPLLNTTATVLSDLPDDVNKQVAFADDAVGSGKLKNLRDWWDAIVKHGPGYGYHANASKTWLVVKEKHLQNAIQMFAGSGVKITAAGKKHLGAAIGSAEYKSEFVTLLVEEWTKQIIALAQVAESEPHAAYAAFIRVKLVQNSVQNSVQISVQI